MRQQLQDAFCRWVAAICLSTCWLEPGLVGAWTATPRNSVTIDDANVPTLMQLSGLAYVGLKQGSAHEFLGVQDSGSGLVTLSFQFAVDGTIVSATAHRRERFHRALISRGSRWDLTAAYWLQKRQRPQCDAMTMQLVWRLIRFVYPNVFESRHEPRS